MLMQTENMQRLIPPDASTPSTLLTHLKYINRSYILSSTEISLYYYILLAISLFLPSALSPIQESKTRRG